MRTALRLVSKINIWANSAHDATPRHLCCANRQNGRSSHDKAICFARRHRRPTGQCRRVRSPGCRPCRRLTTHPHGGTKRHHRRLGVRQRGIGSGLHHCNLHGQGAERAKQQRAVLWDRPSETRGNDPASRRRRQCRRRGPQRADPLRQPFRVRVRSGHGADRPDTRQLCGPQRDRERPTRVRAVHRDPVRIARGAAAGGRHANGHRVRLSRPGRVARRDDGAGSEPRLPRAHDLPHPGSS